MPAAPVPPPPPGLWPRAIIHIDMNAFFAAIEQQDFPHLRGRPVAVTNGEAGTCIITCSYEARSFGVHTGMRLREAQRLCPDLIRQAARPGRYASVSTRIMAGLQDITPDIEVFSVDEAFLDVTHCQRLWGAPEVIARLVRDNVEAGTGLPCSIGVSGDKTTAKFAAKLVKPNGLTLIPPWEAAARLRDEPVTALCGIGPGIAAFLARHGAQTCGEVARLPISVLARRFGNPGRRLWYMCQGRDPEGVQVNVAAPKSIGHGKVVPPNTRDPRLVHTWLSHMSEKVAARLRRHDFETRDFFIGLRTAEGWLGGRRRCALPTRDGRIILSLCRQVMRDDWRGEGIFQVQVTALAPQPFRNQRELFIDDETRRDAVHRVMDRINGRYGDFTLAPGRLLGRSTMPDVIAPAWKPHGHRRTV